MPTSSVRYSHEYRREFLKTLGIGGAIVAGEFTLSEIRDEVTEEPTAELSAMGRAIRTDLEGQLDADLLGTELEHLAGQVEGLSAVREAGIPTADSTMYQELAEPAWRVNDHLLATGWYENLETHLPAFTADHIGESTREVVRTEPLTAPLSELGFTDEEVTTLVGNVATNKVRLARWAPTKELPAAEVEFDLENVPPLHHRAAEGSLLWIDDLDLHLWQKEILITEEILDRSIWHVKKMLGGFYLMATVAADLAAGGDLSDSQLTAALTAATATMILGQEDLTNDVYRLTDEMRASRS
jgi:hypothetical protein